MSKFLSAVERNALLMLGSEGNLDEIQQLFHNHKLGRNPMIVSKSDNKEMQQWDKGWKCRTLWYCPFSALDWNRLHDYFDLYNWRGVIWCEHDSVTVILALCFLALSREWDVWTKLSHYHNSKDWYLGENIGQRVDQRSVLLNTNFLFGTENVEGQLQNTL